MPEQIEATTLIEAVQLFLAELEPELKGRRAFHAKVAGNALAIVARELAQQPQAREQTLLAGVMGHDAPLDTLRTRMCDQLRAGTMGAATPGLVDALLGLMATNQKQGWCRAGPILRCKSARQSTGRRAKTWALPHRGFWRAARRASSLGFAGPGQW